MGRKHAIETPEKLLQMWQEYKSSSTESVFTLLGFKKYVKKNTSANAIHCYFSNNDNRYGNYVGVCSKIREEIEHNLLSGYKKGLVSHSYVIRLKTYNGKDLQKTIPKKHKEDQFVMNEGLVTINKKYLKKKTTRSLSYNNVLDEIYVLKVSGTNIYKIGVSGNTKRRIQDLRAANPFNLELVHYQKCLLAADLEMLLHKMLDDKHIKNEWFVIDDIETYLKIIKSY